MSPTAPTQTLHPHLAQADQVRPELLVDAIGTVEEYLDRSDWRVNGEQIPRFPR